MDKFYWLCTEKLWQVGDPNNDHDCWERREDMDTVKTVYKIDKKHHGSEVVDETITALTLASSVFCKSNPLYSTQLIRIVMRVNTKLLILCIYSKQFIHTDTMLILKCLYLISLNSWHSM